MSSKRPPLVLGFGHEAQQGKDHAAKTILRERGGSLKIVVVAFADALRAHITEAINNHVASFGSTRQEAMQSLCHIWNAEYIPDAPVDSQYPDGKQRYLLQNCGQGMRAVDPDYWANILGERIKSIEADVIIITDVRQPNEFHFVWSLGGVNVKFIRYGFAGIGKAASHVSETSLKYYPFDHTIGVHDGEQEKLDKYSLQLFDRLVRWHNSQRIPIGF